MFTQRHYEAVARRVRGLFPVDMPNTVVEGVVDVHLIRVRDWARTVNAFADSFAEDNPRFNRERFVRACQDGVAESCVRCGRVVDYGTLDNAMQCDVCAVDLERWGVTK